MDTFGPMTYRGCANPKKPQGNPGASSEVKVIIHVPQISGHRKESFWYYDQHIATLEREDLGLRVYIESAGEQRVHFSDNGPRFSGEKAVKEAKRLGWGDKRLNRDAYFSLNNWFDVTADWGGVNEDPWSLLYTPSSSDGEVAISYKYDEAIEVAKEFLKSF